MLAYYPDRSSPLLVKIGSQGVTGTALLCGMYAATEPRRQTVGRSVWHWELQAAALLKSVWWGMHLANLLAHLLWSPYIIGQTIIFLPCYFYLLLFFFLA